MDYVFISHVEEDADAALEIALLLEQHGHTTWTYELDSVPGPSYLERLARVIADCRVFLLVASRQALASPQMPKEIVQAHEAGKKFLPVLRNMTDAELKAEDPEWRMAIGAATSIPYEPDDLPALGAKLASGLGFLRIMRREPDRPRIERLRQRLARVRATPPRPEPASVLPLGPPPAAAPTAARPIRLGWLAAGVATMLLLALFATQRERSAQPTNVVVGVMDIRRHGEVAEWMSEFTRDGLNSVLNDLGKVPVFSKQKIDFVRSKRGLSEIEAAEELGITRMISGTLSATAAKLLLQLQIIDISADGVLLATTQVQGSEDQLLAMQNDAAFDVLRRLGIKVSDAERREVLAMRSNDLQDYYQLLANTMGALEPAQPGQAGTPAEPRIPPGVWNLIAPPDAFAVGAAEEPNVRALLDRYRAALEEKDVDGIGALYVAMNDSMRAALSQYFRNAEDLKVGFSQYDILIEGDEALATFTRVDTFKDTATGRDVRLQVQVNSIVIRQPDGWRIKLVRR